MVFCHKSCGCRVYRTLQWFKNAMLKEDAPCNKSSAKQAVSNLSAARSTAPPHSIPGRAPGTIFSSSVPEAQAVPHWRTKCAFPPACTVQRSSPMCTIRAAFVRILPLCIRRNALFPDADPPTQGQGRAKARPWPFLIPVKLFRMKYARNAMFQPSPAHIFLWTNKFHPFTIVVLHQKGRKRNHSWENVHSLQDCSSFSPRTI